MTALKIGLTRNAAAAVRLIPNAVKVTRERRHTPACSAVRGNLPKLPKFLKLPNLPISAPNHTTHPTQKKYGATHDDSIFIIYRYRLLDNHQWLISLNGVALSNQDLLNEASIVGGD